MFFRFLLLVLLCRTIQAECQFGQYQCKSGNKCVDLVQRCNGVNDCPDGSDETDNCADGCKVNNTVIPQNTTGQDMEWWFVCLKSKWVLSGCVIHGHRFSNGEMYRMFTNDGIFWGKCEQIKPGFYMRQPQGCVDVRGKSVSPGETFMINDVFWGICQIKKNTTTSPEVGTVTLNEVSWRVTGCNNGSQTMLKEGDVFPWIFDPYVILGVNVKCKIPAQDKEFPTLNPTSCIVGVNKSSSWEVRILNDHCYMSADDLIFYCAIYNKSPFVNSKPTGQEPKRFSLNITENTPKEKQKLEADKYKPCYTVDQALTGVANTPKAPPKPLNPANNPAPNPRGKRSLSFESVEWNNIAKTNLDGRMSVIAKSLREEQLSFQ